MATVKIEKFCGLQPRVNAAMLADGKVERTEIERVVMNVKNAITMWHK